MRPPAKSASSRPTPTSPPPAAAALPSSPWHSPVPYLFGGLAAMLGLIAFALLILACSYWKLSGYLEGGAGRGDEDGSGADGAKPAASDLPPPIWEEKILVIMAGDVKPTYLATPMSSRASSFGDRSNKSDDEAEKKVQEVAMASIKDAEQNGEHSESRREREEHHIPEV